jgi:hypothetical protein
MMEKVFGYNLFDSSSDQPDLVLSSGEGDIMTILFCD